MSARMVQLQPRIHGGARKTVLSCAGGSPAHLSAPSPVLAATHRVPRALRLHPCFSCSAAQPPRSRRARPAPQGREKAGAGVTRSRHRGRAPPPPPWTPSRDGGAGERFSHVTEAPAPGPMRTWGRGFRGRRAGREPRAPAAAGETRSRPAGWWGRARRGPGVSAPWEARLGLGAGSSMKCLVTGGNVKGELGATGFGGRGHVGPPETPA